MCRKENVSQKHIFFLFLYIFHVKCERNCKWFKWKWFCKSKAICYTYYLSNEVHQIAKCQSSSKAQMPLISLYLSPQNCISWISQFKDQNLPDHLYNFYTLEEHFLFDYVYPSLQERARVETGIYQVRLLHFWCLSISKS